MDKYPGYRSIRVRTSFNTIQDSAVAMTTTLSVTSLIFGLLASASAQSLETCIESALGHNTLLYAFDNFQDITDLAYELTDVHPYNLDYPWTPTAVTYPTTNKQAADVVSCAKQFNRTVQARSGGHSYQNYCESSTTKRRLHLCRPLIDDCLTRPWRKGWSSRSRYEEFRLLQLSCYRPDSHVWRRHSSRQAY